jgi:hypothetical protein
MSHVTKVTTKISNLELVAKALQFMGVEFKAPKDQETVRMWGGQNFKAPIVIKQSQYDVGISMENSNVQLKADSYAWSELFRNPKVKAFAARAHADEKTFGGILTQACNIVSAIEVAKAEGHEVIVSEPNASGVVQIRVNA